MSVANYAPVYEFKGAVRATSAPSDNTDLVRKQDVSGLSFISSIAAGSSSMISVSGGELSVSNLLISDVTVNSASASLSAFLTANSSHGLQKGDILVLTNPTPSQSWIHNGGSAGDSSDFTQLNTALTYSAGTGLNLSGTTFNWAGVAGTGIAISGATISHNMTAGTGLNLSGAEFSADQAYIRGSLSASSGIDYNSSTGAITADQGEIRGFFSASNGVNYDSGTGAISADQAEIRAMFSASSGVNYDSSTGAITADNGEIRALFSASAGVDYNSSTGAISADQSEIRGFFSGASGVAFNAGTGAITMDVSFIRYAASNQSLTANTALTLTHNLGEKLVHVSALRTSDSKAVDLEVEYLSTTQLKVKSAVNVTVDIAVSA